MVEEEAPVENEETTAVPIAQPTFPPKALVVEPAQPPYELPAVVPKTEAVVAAVFGIHSGVEIPTPVVVFDVPVYY
jgi:hypothetical protein